MVTGEDSSSHWEDAIDIDDSDLPSLLTIPILPSPNPTIYNLSSSLRPCSHSQSQNPNHNPNPNPNASPSNKSSSRRLIPGPAGAVQAAMHRKSSAAAAAAAQSPVVRSQLILAEEEEDWDFKLNPWLSAAAFLGRDFETRWPIGSIKNRKSDRVPQVVGVVKSSVPNGLGDLFVTLKDPTGMVGASIHRSVLTKSNLGGEISVGCVLILKQVSVFCPGHSACYLNITINNMVKVFSKDCGPPDKHMMSSSEARYSFGKQMEARQNLGERVNLQRGNKESIACNEVSREIYSGRIMDCRMTSLPESLPHDITARDSNVVTKSNHMRNIPTDIPARLDIRSINSKILVDKPDLRTNTAKNIVSQPDTRVDGVSNIAGVSNLRTDVSTDATTNKAAESDIRMKEPEKMISNVSAAAQWTDEQLSQLFADIQDDAMCF